MQLRTYSHRIELQYVLYCFCNVGHVQTVSTLRVWLQKSPKAGDVFHKNIPIRNENAQRSRFRKHW